MLLFIDNPIGLIGVFVLALLLFGPQKMPEIAHSLGKALRELKRATSDFTNAMNTDDHHTTYEPPRYDHYSDSSSTTSDAHHSYETNTIAPWQPETPAQTSQAAMTSAPAVIGDHAASAFGGYDNGGVTSHPMPAAPVAAQTVAPTTGGDDYGIVDTPKENTLTVRPADATVPRSTH